MGAQRAEVVVWVCILVIRTSIVIRPFGRLAQRMHQRLIFVSKSHTYCQPYVHVEKFLKTSKQAFLPSFLSMSIRASVRMATMPGCGTRSMLFDAIAIVIPC